MARASAGRMSFLPAEVSQRFERPHELALCALACLLGLLEGPAQIAAVAALLTGILAGRLKGWHPDLVDLGILLWLLAGIPGSLDDQRRWSSEQSLRPALVIGYVLARASLATLSGPLLRRLAILFTVACVLNGLYGWLQVLAIDPPIERMIIGRTRTDALADPSSPGRLLMATGLFYNRIKLAHVGVIGLSLLAVVAAIPERSGRKQRLIDVLFVLILGGAVLLSLRRAAPVGLVVASIVTAALLRRWRLTVVGAGMALATGAIYVFSARGTDRLADSSAAIGERLAMLSAGWAMFCDHWPLGVGHGDYGAAITAYAGALAVDVRDPRDLLSNAHNLYLQVLAETGFIGFAGFVLAVGLALVRVVRRCRETPTASIERAAGDRFALLGLLTLLAIACVHFILYQGPVALLFWLLVGLAAGPLKQRRSNLGPSAPTSKTSVRGTTATQTTPEGSGWAGGPNPP